MKTFLRKLLLGTYPIKEYETITIDNEIKEKVLLKTEKGLLDISTNQFLLCLDPIVFGIWVANNNKVIQVAQKNFQLHFTTSTIEKDSILLAKASLKYAGEIVEEEGKLLLLRLKRSRIYHLNPFKLYLVFYKYYKKPGLSFKKLKSLVCAYSYPRKVRIVSFRNANYYNIFPMDLLGEIKEIKRFAFGLRHTNLALSKIIQDKKIVASDISFQYKDIIYQLGKHHGTIPPLLENLPFNIKQTIKWSFYIPEWANRYKEIQLLKTMDLGSHMLLWGKFDNEVIFNNQEAGLYHIHYLLQIQKLKTNSEYRVVL